MGTFTKYVFGVMLVAAGFIANAQTVVFSENFNSSLSLPAGWQSIDNDGLTNDPDFVSNWGGTLSGWEVDVLAAGNNAVFSTSWYAPPGIADDWLISPAISIPANASLSWKARAFDTDFPDGYQVFVATTNTIAGFLATTPVFSIAAEGTAAFTTRTASLASFSGQTVYVAFRNNSNDKNLLGLDDIEVLQLASTDTKIDSSSFPLRYSSVPKSQITQFNLSARILNNGAGPVTNVTVKVDILKLSAGNTLVYSVASSPVATLAAGARTGMLTPTTPFTPTDTGLYLIRYIAQMTEAQGSTTDDTVAYAVLVDDSLYATDYNLFLGLLTGAALSIGDTNTTDKMLGTVYDVVKNATIKDVEFLVRGPRVGDTLRAVIYAVSGTGAPTVKIGETALRTIAASDTFQNAAYFKLPLTTPLNVNAGTRFYAAVVEGRRSSLGLGTSGAIFTTNKFLARFQNQWIPLEALGAQFRVSFVLRVNLGKQCHTLTQSSTNATCGQTNGSATVTPQGGSGGPYTYTWSVPGSTGTITGVASGSYQVTVSDGDGCNVTATVNVGSVGGPTISSTSKTDVNCFGQSTGTATVTATGNGLTYEWSTTPAQTTATANGLAAGQYTVTVKDNQNCINTASVTITQPSSAVAGTATKVADVNCFGGTTGKAVAVGSGGTGPYTYAWSSTPAQTTDSLLGVGAGNYTVTITDSKSCTNTLGVSITQPSSAVSLNVNKTDATGGQNNGTAVAVVTGGTSPYTYAWSGSAVTSNSRNNLAPGNYSVTVTDSKGCTATTSFVIGGNVGIADRNEIFSSLSVFPIPASTVVNIKADLKNNESMSIQMMDVAGKVVYTAEEAASTSHTVAIDVNKFAKGVYTITMKTKSGVAYQQVVVE